MSYEYRSRLNTTGFTCNLKCMRCMGATRANRRCSRNTCKYLPYCHSHLKSQLGLRVGASAHGDGVFATRNLPAGMVIPYAGEVLTNAGLDPRYGADDLDIAPYTYQTRANHNIDAACKRFIAAKINDASAETSQNAAYRAARPQYNAKFEPIGNNARIRLTRAVPAGQELFVDYGRPYWQAMHSAPPNVVSRNRTSKIRHPTHVAV